jgi:hypothetical protein
MERRSRRVLVALPEPGYFRMYGSTIVELGRRGWDVLIAFDRPGKRGDVPLVPANAGPSIRSVGAVPDAGRSGWLPTLRAAADYLRYLEPRFAGAEYLRRRSERSLPPEAHLLTRLPRLPPVVVGGAIRLIRAVERLVPADAALQQWLRDIAPDVLLVSPLVALGRTGGAQTELVKAARRLRTPVMVGAASWDNLTSKGLVRVVPDVLTVWNEAQREEARALHRIPARRIVITGGQSLDHWFEPVPEDATEAVRVRLGVPPGQPLILLTGSSLNMSGGEREVRFVERWVAAIRSAGSPLLRSATILVRPHPSNLTAWRDVRLGAGVHVEPRSYSGIPMSDAELEFFRHCILASSAVVGVNTTAMIEAAILDRPVLSVRDPEFAHSQDQTLHFNHLAADSGGCALVADSLDEHLRQLADVIADPLPTVSASRKFVERFVRPRGLATPSTIHLCDAIEAMAPSVPAAVAAADPAVVAQTKL